MKREKALQLALEAIGQDVPIEPGWPRYVLSVLAEGNALRGCQRRRAEALFRVPKKAKGMTASVVVVDEAFEVR